MRFCIALLPLLAGCSSSVFFGPSSVYRVRVDGGATVQCAQAADVECGLTLKECSNKHEYHCLHAVDLEHVPADTPMPAPVAPPQPPAPVAPQK